ncbi:hypothetical protein CK203_052200 [Vitis vinifera]|uniref:Uncharacterized protein n=1 Tax=Vitis vinifera TaxID=29760 RepID=A0A438GPG6_VITVI|nr:hypothetical protein CK203_052200 [Vitis vinifera]
MKIVGIFEGRIKVEETGYEGYPCYILFRRRRAVLVYLVYGPNSHKLRRDFWIELKSFPCPTYQTVCGHDF